jgi:hypothetical protein
MPNITTSDVSRHYAGGYTRMITFPAIPLKKYHHLRDKRSYYLLSARNNFRYCLVIVIVKKTEH